MAPEHRADGKPTDLQGANYTHLRISPLFTAQNCLSGPTRGPRRLSATGPIHRAAAVAGFGPHTRGARADARGHTDARSASASCTHADARRDTHAGGARAHARSNAHARRADTRGRRPHDTAFRYTDFLAIDHSTCRWCKQREAHRQERNRTNHELHQFESAKAAAASILRFGSAYLNPALFAPRHGLAGCTASAVGSTAQCDVVMQKSGRLSSNF